MSFSLSDYPFVCRVGFGRPAARLYGRTTSVVKLPFLSHPIARISFALFCARAIHGHGGLNAASRIWRELGENLYKLVGLCSLRNPNAVRAFHYVCSYTNEHINVHAVRSVCGVFCGHQLGSERASEKPWLSSYYGWFYGMVHWVPVSWLAVCWLIIAETFFFTMLWTLEM